jgi:hypothetical protein
MYMILSVPFQSLRPSIYQGKPVKFFREHGVLSEQKQGHTMWRGATTGAIDLGIVELYIDLSMTLIRQRDPWKCAHQV